MKDVLMVMHTNKQAAEDSRVGLRQDLDQIKGNFLNEMAFEFDKQRYCAIGWGLVLGALICSTVYKRGKPARQGALFLTCGHAFG